MVYRVSHFRLYHRFPNVVSYNRFVDFRRLLLFHLQSLQKNFHFVVSCLIMADFKQVWLRWLSSCPKLQANLIARSLKKREVYSVHVNLPKTSGYRRQKHHQKKRRWLQSLPKPSPYNSWLSWRLNDASWPGNYPSVAPSSLWFQIPDGLENTSHLPKFLRPPQKNLKLTNSPSVTVFRKILLMSLSLLLILSDSGRDVMRMTE